jgi:cystathionine beta-lyase/cystathionine gamma-synthase
VSLSAPERAAQGLPDGFVRVSVGVEDPEDLIADFRQALDALKASAVA